jgi:hypothetical protein
MYEVDWRLWRREMVVYVLPASTMYVYIKAFRVLLNRWHETIQSSQDDAQKAVIKRILRLIGFASLVGAGVLQFPATLF